VVSSLIELVGSITTQLSGIDPAPEGECAFALGMIRNLEY
jgi:hypothetical protein